MSTSLKNQYADEILEVMAEKLSDESFTDLFHKEASLEKEGQQSEAFTSFHKEIGDRKDYDSLVAAYEKWGPGMAGAEKESAAAEVEKRTGRRPPGERVPPVTPADDQLIDDREAIAADFALKHLVKIADTLDSQGFDAVATIIDETIEKVAKKKSKED